MKHPGLLLLICLLSLTGCVIRHHNTITTSGDTRTLKLTTSAAGLLLGPCAPYWGKDTLERAVFRLRGIKDTYFESDFDIVGTRYAKQDMQGFISIDRKRRTVHIEVYVNGEPFRYNGYYLYTTEDK